MTVFEVVNRSRGPAEPRRSPTESRTRLTLANPHKPIASPSDSEPNPKPAALVLAAAFFLVPLISCILAFPLFDYAATVDRQLLTTYFLLGGHALTLALIWYICKSRSGMTAPAAIALAILYLGTVGICWLVVAFGVISWT
ncbi:hypothetical protein [Crateriforma spongiae]|uniref:hypothetical protein n=1 Tax=Crateriforma spongiae TaxID=2724528 RepID=UPI0039AFEC15